ncbi:MAG TPA: hypothetical protein PKU78_06410 [Candidatus Dojkabacteria bacterium]|nr:hypothetical protein [Candidatus Dojkabacteria bacterium]
MIKEIYTINSWEHLLVTKLEYRAIDSMAKTWYNYNTDVPIIAHLEFMNVVLQHRSKNALCNTMTHFNIDRKTWITVLLEPV